jgi:hypothetical protein
MPSLRLIAALAATMTSALPVLAQSAAHLGVRSVVQTGPSGAPRLLGASTQLDITARERLDVRFHVGVAGGSRRVLGGCPLDPAVNCAPREIQVDLRRTSVGVALPLRLVQRGAFDWRVVPGLDGHDIDGSVLLGASLGLEGRYQRSLNSRFMLVAAGDMNRTSALGITAGGPAYRGTFTRVSLGARYRFYTRR